MVNSELLVIGSLHVEAQYPLLRLALSQCLLTRTNSVPGSFVHFQGLCLLLSSKYLYEIGHHYY